MTHTAARLACLICTWKTRWGEETIERLVGSSSYLLIVVYTASRDPKMEASAIALGANNYLVKGAAGRSPVARSTTERSTSPSTEDPI